MHRNGFILGIVKFCFAFLVLRVSNPDASREALVDNEGFSNIHTKTQLSTDASREALVDNDLF